MGSYEVVRRRVELESLGKDRNQGHSRNQAAGIKENPSEIQIAERGEGCIGLASIDLARTRAGHLDRQSTEALCDVGGGD